MTTSVLILPLLVCANLRNSMKVTYNWLKDFVEIKIPARRLADKLTMAGLEVVSLEEKAGDWVFEIEVTSNRPDCLSVVGVAREVAAATNAKCKMQNAKLQCKIKNLSSGQDKLKVYIANKKDCPLYTAKVIRGVKVGPSPQWLRQRLELVGCRSVNNVVDITNYVLFELGEPLHAFDLDKLAPSSELKIHVRRAKAGEKMISIDGEEKLLSPEILVIADAQKPVAVAGIMGGRDTEVGLATRNIILEAAVFNSLLVRRGKRILGIDSESAYRFERGVPAQQVELASGRAAQLIREICAGELVWQGKAGSCAVRKKTVALTGAGVKRVLGNGIAKPESRAILKRLGFALKNISAHACAVQVPYFRQDVTQEADLIEELARISGFGHFPSTLPKVAAQPAADKARGIVAQIKAILVGLGLNEVITYSLVERDLAAGFSCPAGQPPAEILNPLSREQEVLRAALAPSLARCVAYNLNQQQDYVNIFEVANAYLEAAPAPREELRLGIALCGRRKYFTATGLAQEGAGLLHLKGVMEALLQRLGISDYRFLADESAGADIYLAAEKIGQIFVLPEQAQIAAGIKHKEVFCLEVSLEKVIAAADLQRRFSPLPKFPGISRDISVVLREDIPAAEVIAALKAQAGALLAEARVADYYHGKQIPLGSRGITFSCFYRCAERTLTEEEVAPLHSRACQLLQEKFQAQLR